MEQRNNFFFIEQINGVFDRKQTCVTHVYTRVRNFWFGCFGRGGSMREKTVEQKLVKAVKAAGGMGVTMHRAFDVCRDPFEALEQCVSLGIDTILTSGQKSSAWEGRELLSRLAERAAGRLDILAGAGIGPDVIGELAACTGVKAFHMSGKKVIDSRMGFRREGVPMGIPGSSEFEIWQTDAEKVREAAGVLKKLEARQKL